uniref:FadR family transcriptional regulator n=1 Tax=Anaerolinea thermolimosa TaxID=229919 RepID=A0A7C4PGD5_9CHLR
MAGYSGEKTFLDYSSPFLRYLATHFSDGERLPALSVISQELGVSLASLREQLEVARALGVVEVRPKTGIRRLSYSFKPAVIHSLNYAMLVDERNFRRFAELRTHIEAAYWHQAVSLLTEDDLEVLGCLLKKAEEKLSDDPPQIPHPEHRELHLTIFKRLENPFVFGILEAYWDFYEAVGLAMYTDINYLKTVWNYHRQMVEAIRRGEVDRGYRALLEHADLLQARTPSTRRQTFE